MAQGERALEAQRFAGQYRFARYRFARYLLARYLLALCVLAARCGAAPAQKAAARAAATGAAASCVEPYFCHCGRAADRRSRRQRLGCESGRCRQNRRRRGPPTAGRGSENLQHCRWPGTQVALCAPRTAQVRRVRFPRRWCGTRRRGILRDGRQPGAHGSQCWRRSMADCRPVRELARAGRVQAA
jgi:hypothetical protein